MKRFVEQHKRLARGLGYGGLFVVSFLLFCYWTFPYDRLRGFIVQEVERPKGPDGRRRPSGIELDIEDLSPSWLTGVQLEGVRVSKQGADGSKLTLEVEEATARAGLLSLLWGSTEVDYDLRLGAGTIEGEYEQGEETSEVSATIESVDLKRLALLQDVLGLPVQGTADGDIDLTVAEESAQTHGAINLQIKRLKVGDGKAKLKIAGLGDGITLEQIDVGKVTLDIAVEEGRGTVRQLEANGKDLELTGSGNARLRRPLNLSRLDLLVRFRFKDAYRNRNERTQGLFTLLDMAPQVKPAKTKDGFLQYRVAGMVGARISARPAGLAKMTTPR